jgi:hypothetical protein
LDPHGAFLLHRGVKTLALRVERQNANAALLAAALETHPQVRCFASGHALHLAVTCLLPVLFCPVEENSHCCGALYSTRVIACILAVLWP